MGNGDAAVSLRNNSREHRFVLLLVHVHLLIRALALGGTITIDGSIGVGREYEQLEQDLRIPHWVEIECGPLALRDVVSREVLVAPDDRCRRQRFLFLFLLGPFDLNLLSVLQPGLGLVSLSVLRLVLRLVLVAFVLALVGVHTMCCIPFVLGVLHSWIAIFSLVVFFLIFFLVVEDRLACLRVCTLYDCGGGDGDGGGVRMVRGRGGTGAHGCGGISIVAAVSQLDLSTPNKSILAKSPRRLRTSWLCGR